MENILSYDFMGREVVAYEKYYIQKLSRETSVLLLCEFM